jgi:hypothetical protein
MGFLSGRITYARFSVSGDSPLPFDDDLLEKANLHAIGKHGGAESTDGVKIGWGGGDHVLDNRFELEKNLINDALHLSMRVDTNKVPSSILKAYTTIETQARAHLNPSGRATKSQRTEAKEAAIIRAEAESADGRYLRMAHYPVLWDGQTNTVFVGATSLNVLDRLRTLFRETFDRTLEPLTAGTLAVRLAELRGEGASMETFGPLHDSPVVSWANEEGSSHDVLGNEFLLWLWHTLQNDSDTLALSDGSEATVMVAKTLTLDCPRGENGRDQLTTEGPTRLPEAFRALQGGKLPRKAGLIIVRHGMQYELTLQAETFSVSGANLPKPEDAQGDEAKIARIDGLRHLVETLDLIYDTFTRRRIGSSWTGDMGRIRSWLTAA